MPLYAYRCTQCGHRFEKIQNFSAEPELECSKCGGPLERPLTAPRLHFKGAGWYVNDYAPKSSESGSDSASSETKTGEAAAAKTDSSISAPAPVSSTAPASAPSSASAAPSSAPSSSS